MIDTLLLVWIFAQAATSGVTPALVGGVVSAILTAPATVALVRYADNRAKHREVNERARIDAANALAVAKVQADAATRRAEEEEETGRHALNAEQRKLEMPLAERFALAERDERHAVQAKLEAKERTVRELDQALATAQEQVRVLRAESIEQSRIIARQAEAIIALSEQNDGLYAWIEEYVARNPGSPKPPKHGRVIAIEEIVTSAKDERRE